jgi:hypothetical protein
MYEPLGLCAWWSQGADSRDSFVRDHSSDYHVSPNSRSMHTMLLGSRWFSELLEISLTSLWSYLTTAGSTNVTLLEKWFNGLHSWQGTIVLIMLTESWHFSDLFKGHTFQYDVPAYKFWNGCPRLPQEIDSVVLTASYKMPVLVTIFVVIIGGNYVQRHC